MIEGSLAGGHLGFKKADLENQTCQSLEEILADVLDLIADWPNRPMCMWPVAAVLMQI